MTDIGLTYNPTFQAWDIALDGADLAQDDGLQTAIVLSLFLDRHANADDPLPPGSTRRGWWGDRVAPLARPACGNGSTPDRIGSRLWIVWRERQLPALLPRVKDIIAEALAWLVEDGWASSLDIAVSFPARGRLAYSITAHKPTGGTINVTQHVAWGI
jgi:phage gp46-like protein